MTRRQSALRRSGDVAPERIGCQAAEGRADAGMTTAIVTASAAEATESLVLSSRESLDSGVGAGLDFFSKQPHTAPLEQHPPLPQQGQDVDAFAPQQLA